MCGRYYIDTNWLDEIGNVVYSFDIDWKICKEQFQGDILPTNTAPIIEKTEHGLQLSLCKWGFPLQKGKNLVHPEHMCWGFMSKYQEGLLINARAETVLDKPSFSNGIWYHRIVIPASGFYEWNRLREKNTFTRSDASVLYLAGFCDWFDNERRFVILTTVANEQSP